MQLACRQRLSLEARKAEPQSRVEAPEMSELLAQASAEVLDEHEIVVLGRTDAIDDHGAFIRRHGEKGSRSERLELIKHSRSRRLPGGKTQQPEFIGVWLEWIGLDYVVDTRF
jgi:hypothetical protein